MSDEQQNPTPQTPDPTGLSMEDALEQIKKERDEYLLGWQRARADYENMQKRLSEQRDEDRRRVRANLAEDLLAVVDNFGYVTKHIPDVAQCPDDFQKKFTAWASGITHIDRQFAEALKNMGVEPIEAVGKPFDAKLHEAASTRHEEGVAGGTILEEIIKGWKLGDVVLRPSKVVVSDDV